MFHFSKIPLVRILLPFCLGLLIQKYSFSLITNELYFSLTIFAFVLLLMLAFTQFKVSKSFERRWVFGASSTFLLIILGLAYGYQFEKNNMPKPLQTVKETKWIGEVKSARISQSGYYNYQLDLSAYNQGETWIKEGFSILMYSNSKESGYVAHVGDVISGFSKIVPIRGPLNPNEFDYRAYCKNRGIYYSTFENEPELLYHNLSLNSIAEEYRKVIIQWFVDLGIKGDELAVLSALTLGDKSGLSQGLKTNYAAAGAMHILAVSGLHVGIIYLIFSYLLGLIKNNKKLMRWLKALILLLVIWIYALITGFSPSVQRAACMFSFIIISIALKRHSHIINSIAGSALLVILINPNILYEVGFQLSYSAVLGIVIIHPLVYPLLSLKYTLLDKIWSLSIVSLSAQIATLPLTIYYFHQFPNWFLLVNLFVIPLAFLIVSLAILTCLLWALFKIHLGVALLLKFLLGALNKLIEFSQLLPFSVSEGIWLSNGSLVLLIVVIVLIAIYLETKLFRYLKLTLIFILCISAIEFSMDFKQLSNKSVGFYALKGTPVSFVNGLEAEVMLPEPLSYNEREIISNHLISQGVRKLRWFSSIDTLNKSRFFDCQKFNDNMVLSHASEIIYYLNNDSSQHDLTALNPIVIFNDQTNTFFDDFKSKGTKIIIPVRTPYWREFHFEPKYIHDLRFEGYAELQNL